MLSLDLAHFAVSEILGAICVSLLLFYVTAAIYRKRGKNLPPGPVGLPIVGYLPFLTDKAHLKFCKLASKYGNIFSLRLGSKFVVVLNSGKAIREAFSKAEFLGRPPDTIFSIIEKFESPFFSSGKAWQEHRRFVLHTMKDLGFGKSRMEKHIIEEVEHFLDLIKKDQGNPVIIKEILTPSISNNIAALVFGCRYDYDDSERKFLNSSLEATAKTISQASGYIFCPWLRKLPFSSMIFDYQHFRETIGKFRQFVRKHIEHHKRTMDPNNIRDYIDGYLLEMEHRKVKDSDTSLSENMLVGSVINLFNAGSETGRNTVDWCLYTMAAYLDVQRKVQSEIDEIIGTERFPSWSDHKDMPYTRSVLMEVSRWQTVFPVSVLRYTLGDTTLRGYNIPAGTMVFANLWGAHHDPEEWDNPSAFKPDRFLSGDGMREIKPDSYMPFSTGKRSCPGEILALMEVFLYFTSVLQRFSVEIPKGELVSVEGQLSLTYHRKQRPLCFRPRF